MLDNLSLISISFELSLPVLTVFCIFFFCFFFNRGPFPRVSTQGDHLQLPERLLLHPGPPGQGCRASDPDQGSQGHSAVRGQAEAAAPGALQRHGGHRHHRDRRLPSQVPEPGLRCIPSHRALPRIQKGKNGSGQYDVTSLLFGITKIPEI